MTNYEVIEKMEYDPIVSIIIPVYNSELFLENCLKSVTDQTYTNLEIIIINDGSTDNSISIIDYFLKRDTRITFINQDNQGPGNARNKGIQFASGDYLICIDSDDMLEPYAVRTLVEKAEYYRADVVVYGIKISGIESDVIKPTSQDVHISKDKIIETIIFDDREYGGGFTVNKFWNRKSRINLFDAKLWTYEDKVWCIQNFFGCQQIVLISDVLYIYNVHDGSLSHNMNFSWKKNSNSLMAYKAIPEIVKDNHKLFAAAEAKYQYELSMSIASALKRKRTDMIPDYLKEIKYRKDLFKYKGINNWGIIKYYLITFLLIPFLKFRHNIRPL